MKIHLEQIKTNNKFHEEKSGFVYSGFVKTCDELVKGHITTLQKWKRVWKTFRNIWNK